MIYQNFTVNFNIRPARFVFHLSLLQRSITGKVVLSLNIFEAQRLNIRSSFVKRRIYPLDNLVSQLLPEVLSSVQ